jgi:hypothetical protein
LDGIVHLWRLDLESDGATPLLSPVGHRLVPGHADQSYLVAEALDSDPNLLSDRLGAKWGLQVVSDSRPGAAGNIAAQAAARAAPDGYNYFLAVASTLAVNPYTFKSLPFDVERDFVPVINIGISPFMIAVNPALPVTRAANRAPSRQAICSVFCTSFMRAVSIMPTMMARNNGATQANSTATAPRCAVRLRDFATRRTVVGTYMAGISNIKGGRGLLVTHERLGVQRDVLEIGKGQRAMWP